MGDSCLNSHGCSGLGRLDSTNEKFLGLGRGVPRIWFCRQPDVWLFLAESQVCTPKSPDWVRLLTSGPKSPRGVEKEPAAASTTQKCVQAVGEAALS